MPATGAARTAGADEPAAVEAGPERELGAQVGPVDDLRRDRHIATERGERIRGELEVALLVDDAPRAGPLERAVLEAALDALAAGPRRQAAPVGERHDRAQLRPVAMRTIARGPVGEPE